MLNTLSLIGVFYIFKIISSWILRSFYGFKTYIWPQCINNEKWIRSLGSWAIVTGCTHGIGLAYAKQLAKRKMNLILIARNEELLKKVSRILESKHAIQTIYIVADLSKTDSYEKIKRIIQTKDIGLLVNNVGTSHMPMLFHQADEETLEAIINCNAKTVMLLSRMVLPEMINKNKGAIVNVSSQTSTIPANLVCVYASTKAFINKFTETLCYEYRNTNLVFQCLHTGLVKTNASVRGMGKLAKATDLDASKYSSAAITTLGFSRHTCGHWIHGIQDLIMSLLPKFLFDAILPGRLEKMLLNGNKDDNSYDDMDYILNSD